MGRKRVTQVFPWLLPLRKWQKKLFFYGAMYRDGEIYSRDRGPELTYSCFQTEKTIVNPDSGFDIQYQKNKEHNLRLAARTIDGVLIRPGETFSFWQLVRYAEARERYKEGLSLSDGVMVVSSGGGLCQLSNELFWCFLHTPLAIVERHTHRVQEFPGLYQDRPVGTDAAVAEGWLDLKLKNTTSATYQVLTKVFDGQLICEIRSNRPLWDDYEIVARDVRYVKQGDELWEYAKLYRKVWDLQRPEAKIPRMEHWLYENRTRIGYPMEIDQGEIQ